MAALRKSVGDGGKNNKADVSLVQELLNAYVARLGPMKPLSVDGACGEGTIGAIKAFQEKIVNAKSPDGKVDPGGKTWKALAKVLGTIPKDSFLAPEWLKIACAEEGTAEKAGLDKNEARILEYLATVPGLGKIKYGKTTHMMSDVDETAWCACFVKWCVIAAKKSAGPGAQAKSWASYGTALPSGAPKVGAIAVVQRKPQKGDASMTRSGYHVGFYIGGPAQFPVLLGGNQSNKVCRRQFVGWNVLAYRWPV